MENLYTVDTYIMLEYRIYHVYMILGLTKEVKSKRI